MPTTRPTGGAPGLPALRGPAVGRCLHHVGASRERREPRASSHPRSARPAAENQVAAPRLWTLPARSTGTQPLAVKLDGHRACGAGDGLDPVQESVVRPKPLFVRPDVRALARSSVNEEDPGVSLRVYRNGCRVYGDVAEGARGPHVLARRVSLEVTTGVELERKGAT